MDLESDIEKSIEAVKRNNGGVSAMDVEGLAGCVEIANDLPFGLNWSLFKLMSMKQCFVLSTMPGPKEPWHFRMKNGDLVKGVSLTAVGPPVVDHVTGMYVSTCA